MDDTINGKTPNALLTTPPPEQIAAVNLDLGEVAVLVDAVNAAILKWEVLISGNSNSALTEHYIARIEAYRRILIKIRGAGL